jgi:hypothetical protein
MPPLDLSNIVEHMDLDPSVPKNPYYLTQEDLDKFGAERKEEALKVYGLTTPGWYFYDETYAFSYGPFDTEEIAKAKLYEYGSRLASDCYIDFLKECEKERENKCISHIIKFPDLTIRAEEFKTCGGPIPRTVFVIIKDGEGFYVYYDEADESFDAKTIEEMAQSIKAFLESDTCVKETGEFVIEEVKKSEEV